jgi:uncharacterized membrane protein
MKRLFGEENVHRTFEVSLVIKGIFGILEIIGGVLAYFVSQHFLLNLILAVTKQEPIEDPNDVVAHYLIQFAQSFSVSSQLFTSFYLLSHGILKVFPIAGLMRRKLSYYPISIFIFTLFNFLSAVQIQLHPFHLALSGYFSRRSRNLAHMAGIQICSSRIDHRISRAGRR